MAWGRKLLAMARWIAALLLFALPHGAAAGEWTANADDRWLLDLRSGQYRLGDGLRGYQTPAGVCVDFADTVMALDLAVRVDKQLRRATGWVFDERRQLVLDRDAGQVRVGSRTTPIGGGDIVDTPEGWCVQVDKLAKWLELPLIVDLSNAVIRIETKEKMPFQLAAERRARAAKIRPNTGFDLASLPQTTRPYQMWQAPSVDVTASATVVSDGRQGVKAAARYELFAAGEALGASFDARLASNDRAVPESLRVRAYRSDPAGKLLGPLAATHFGVGDVALAASGLVAQTTSGRGAIVTNRPLERPDTFDRTSFQGDLPIGWDAELYRNGQLLGFSGADAAGRYAFLDVPLLYGANRFEIVLYGPQGQVRREIKQMQVGMDSIPPRQTWYWLGFAQENTDLLNLATRPLTVNRGWRGSFGLERGLDTRTSVAANLHSLDIERVRRNYGEVALRRSIGSTIAELGAAIADDGGKAVRANWLAAFGSTYIRAEAMRGWGDFISDRLPKSLRSTIGLSIDQTLTMGRTILPVHFDLRHTERAGGLTAVEGSARVSASLQRLSLTGQLDWVRTTTGRGPGPPDALTAKLLANGRIGRVRLRGEAQFALAGRPADTRLAVVGEWSGARHGEWRAALGYDGAARRGRAGLGYTRQFKAFQISGTGEAASDGAVAASLALAFSLGPRARGGWRVSNQKLASRGQIAAEVWQDLNGDGQRQPGEPGIAGVELTAGNSAIGAVTDAAGRAMIDGLEPHRPIMIGIDGSSLPDPYFQPALPGIVATPRPGVAVTMALPVVAAGEVEGILAQAGGKLLGGIALELVDDAGRVRGVTISEYDGYFLFEAVPYASYRVRIQASSAAAARLDPGFAVTAAPGAARPRVRLGTVTVAAATKFAAN